MNWFKGEIAEAIASSKTKQAIFVVYVEGKDEKSAKVTALIDEEQVARLLGGDSFVAIKIEADSVPYQQFCQIYKQVPVPSLYFIGKQGVPLEIVTEAKDVATLTEALNRVLQKGAAAPVATQSANLIKNEQSAASAAAPAPNVVCEGGVCTIKRDEPSTSGQPHSEEPLAEPQSGLSVEEKVERAKKLVEQKREDKAKEEAEAERQKEIERRKMGQSVQQLKRWQEDQDLKNIMEERERDKRESQLARERVLAQIAQDKAERAAKFSPPQPAPQPQNASQPAPRPVNTNIARLQFKMPDGRTATQDFASSEPLENVHAHIRQNLNLSFSGYTLSTTFPRREFTDNDKSQSLLDLGLAPTAVVLILPVNRGAVAAAGGGGGLTGLLWALLAPVFTVLGYLKTFIFGTGNTSGDGNKRPAEGSTEARSQPKMRRPGPSTVVRRQGNIHRLSNKNDSDDENNTWNGNSTQQM